jgi:hypothetical protein
MIGYQVDECLDSKRLVKWCAAEGLVTLRRFPRKLKEQEDPQVLDTILPSGSSLVTTDREIHWRHSTHIPDKHPGILIVASSDSSCTIRIRDVERILRQFKSSFPGWHSTSLQNSILEITEQQAEVCKVTGGIAARIGWVEFAKEGWQDELRGMLSQSAKGQQAIVND